MAILDQVIASENCSNTYDALPRLKIGGTTGNAEASLIATGAPWEGVPE
jgi:hypothetical protein